MRLLSSPATLCLTVVVACTVLAPTLRGAQAESQDLAPPATLQEIAGLLNRHQLGGAASAAETALRAHPSDPALHNLAGAVAAEQGAYDAAVAHFNEAIRLDPAHPAAYENLGRLYQVQSGADGSARAKALDVYRRLLAIDPANAEGLYQSAFLMALDGRFDDARRLVARLPAPLSGRPHVLALSAVSLSGSGESTAADAALRALAAHPDLSDADVMAMAPAFAHLADDTVAQQLLEALDRRGLARADALQRLGAIHLAHDRPREAIEALNRAAAAGGPTVPVLLDLARATDKLGDHQGALGYLAHARSLAPEDPAVHFLFGIVCIELNLGAEAYESLKRAVGLAPDNAPVNYAMGAVSLHRHEPSEAIPYFEKYVALEPEDPRGRFALGVARFSSSDFDGARRELDRIVDRPETAAGAHYFLARIDRQSNDLVSARRHIDAVLRLNATYPDAWAELGLLQTRAGEYADAERSLQKALSLDADNYPATVNLAALYTRTRDPRREEQVARLADLQQKRGEQAQDFLRTITVVPR